VPLDVPRAGIEKAWPWIKSVERILLNEQPEPFQGRHLLFGSDYSGDHKSSAFKSYAYLIVDTANSPQWFRAIERVRDQILPDGRRMAFKKLNDRVKMSALGPFLEATNEISGHLVGVVLPKSYRLMTTSQTLLAKWRDLPGLKGKWTDQSFEAMCRTAHMFVLLVSLWSRPMTNVTWITDEDEIVANEDRLDDMQQFAARLTSIFTHHPLGIFAMNTTAIHHPERDFEDLVAIPDLAAGMLAEVAGKLVKDGQIQSAREPLAQPLSEKSKMTSDWFWWPHASLKRTCVFFDRMSDRQMRVQKVTMEYLD
jgi:hypothetical protein